MTFHTPHDFSKASYDPDRNPFSSTAREGEIEDGFIGRLQTLKYVFRPDIIDRASLERNFREKFEAINRARLTDADCQARQRPSTTRRHPADPAHSDGQFARLREEIITADVFAAAKPLRRINRFNRDDASSFNRFQEGCVEENTSIAALL